MKKWECTVCGYIHEGDEPPDTCPICGAGKEYFKELVDEQSEGAAETPETAAAEPQAASPETAVTTAGPSALASVVMKLHLHPISVHTPNGVLPLALIFLLLGSVFGLTVFEKASYYNLVFVLLTMPVVIATGYIEWQNRYKGIRTKIFGVKIAASIVVCATLLAMIIWRFIDPGVATSASRWIYILIGVVMVGAAGLAGHMGGKLVFDTRK